MTNQTGIRKLWMTEQLHAALGEYAYQKRTSMSDVLRGVLGDIAKDPLPKWAKKSTDLAAPMKRSVSLVVDDDLWFGARDAAWPTRVSVAKLTRLHLLHKLRSEGFEVNEEAA